MDARKPKKLYFTKGKVPTEEERVEAEKLGITSFRCGTQPSDVVETVELVAGSVPARYSKAVKKQAQPKPEK
jgi:hypothetical protein